MAPEGGVRLAGEDGEGHLENIDSLLIRPVVEVKDAHIEEGSAGVEIVALLVQGATEGGDGWHTTSTGRFSSGSGAGSGIRSGPGHGEEGFTIKSWCIGGIIGVDEKGLRTR